MCKQSRKQPDELDNTHWQRWQMGAFDTQAKNSNAALSEIEQAQQMENMLKAIKEKAQKQAHEKGYAKGFEGGKTEGFSVGHTKGYQEGLAKAAEQMQEASAQHAARLAALITSFSNALETVEADVGQQLIDLAIGIAQQVLRTRLQTHPEALTALVDEIVTTENLAESRLRLRVHPNDAELLQPLLEQHSNNTNCNWLLVSDPSIEAGGCIAESAQGTINARLDTRWQRVIAALGRPAQSSL